MNNWQAIETASKDDGTGQPAMGPVILLSDGTHEIVGRWFGDWQYQGDGGEMQFEPGRWVDKALVDLDWQPTMWCPVA